MKIKRIELEGHPILGDIILDFTDENGEVVNNIIFAGENGTGKTTILELIFEFTNNQLREENRKQCITVIFSNEELNKLKVTSREYEGIFSNGVHNNEVIFKIDHSNRNIIGIQFKNSQEQFVEMEGLYLFGQAQNILKSIYSTTEINFTPQEIMNITAKNIDEETVNSIRSNSNLATEITQLLIDIKALDDAELSDWVNANPGKVPTEKEKKIRMRRFENAFNYIFPYKRYSGIRNIGNTKKIFFKEGNNEMSIEKLSSGEKQIVFRGSFLLKDKESTEGIIGLIDEPEISLHPNWQVKITNYFKLLFSNAIGEQTSQIFFVTHSPFIIHNNNRTDDKVIILKKDEQGKVFIPNEGKYFSWTEEQIIEKAFNLDKFVKEANELKKNLIVTEGKTDWKHLKRALGKLRKRGLFEEDNFEFLEYEDLEMGHGHLLSLCEQLSKLNNDKKIICILDRDVQDAIKRGTSTDKNYKDWGNNVYSFVIPVPEHRKTTPEISIEHYYTDDEIKLEDSEGKRLYLGNEFIRKSGQHITDKDKFCNTKNKVGPEKIVIIDRDSDVFLSGSEDTNIALSKNDFAECILNEVQPFSNVNFEPFKLIFRIIEEIITNG
jgi:predicted ATPase